jgi:WD40 repeat protein
MRPESAVVAAVFSADGKSLFTVGDALDVQVWDAETGRERRRFSLSVPVPEVFSGRLSIQGGMAGFAPDGKTLVAMGSDWQARAYDVQAGRLLRNLGPVGAAFSLSADGKRLAVSGSGEVIVWDVAEGKILRTISGLASNGLASLTPNGKHLVVSWADHSCRLIEVETDRLVRRLETGFTGSDEETPQLMRTVMSGNGELAIFCALSGHLTVTSLETGKPLHRLMLRCGIEQSIALSPNNRFLALGAHPGARIFGLASGKALRQLEGTPPAICIRLVYSTDGKRIAGICRDGSVRIWDVRSSRQLCGPCGHTAPVTGLAFLRDGTLVSAAGDRQLIAWDAATGQHLHECQAMPFDPDTMTGMPGGASVRGVADDLSCHVWCPGHDIESRPAEGVVAPGYLKATSADGQRWAVTRPDGKLHLYGADLEHHEGRVLWTPEKVWIKMMQFSPDGGRFVAVCSDGKIRVWDCASVREVRAFAPDTEVIRGQHLCFTPDGRGLLHDSGELLLYEIASGRKRACVPGPTVGCTALACSVDGLLAARGNTDGSIVVFSLLTGTEVTRFPGDRSQIHSLAFSLDNRLLASGGANGLTLVWKLPTLVAATALLQEPRITTLWQELDDIDAERAARALGGLLAAPGQAIDLLSARLRFSGAAIDRKRLERLVADLDSDAFPVREKASASLDAAGFAAEDLLRKALEKAPSLEARGRLEHLVARLDARVAAPGFLRAVRAVELLECIGTPPARLLLTKLLGEVKDIAIETEMQDSLRRLAAKGAAPGK